MNNTQIARQGTGERMTLAQVQEITGYSLAEMALVRATVAKDAATLTDLALFLHGAKRLGLDPLQKQIYWIVRDGKGGIQVGIDGFRSLAARTKEYAGSEPAIFRGVINADGMDVPEMATVVVWRIVQGKKCAFTGEARWREFYPGPKQGFMWKKMPYAQLAKCAEAQALRKGFPAELGGLAIASGEPDSVGVEVTEVEQPVRRYTVAEAAAEYTRIHGSDDEGTAFADLPRENDPVELIDSKQHPLWLQWLAAEKQAKAAGVELSAITLPQPSDVIESSTRTVLEMVDAKRAEAVGA